jgi:hypothetical protein
MSDTRAVLSRKPPLGRIAAGRNYGRSFRSAGTPSPGSPSPAAPPLSAPSSAPRRGDGPLLIDDVRKERVRSHPTLSGHTLTLRPYAVGFSVGIVDTQDLNVAFP